MIWVKNSLTLQVEDGIILRGYNKTLDSVDLKVTGFETTFKEIYQIKTTVKPDLFVTLDQILLTTAGELKVSEIQEKIKHDKILLKTSLMVNPIVGTIRFKCVDFCYHILFDQKGYFINVNGYLVKM